MNDHNYQMMSEIVVVLRNAKQMHVSSEHDGIVCCDYKLFINIFVINDRSVIFNKTFRAGE